MANGQAALDHFGRVLMQQVRDQAIVDWDMIVNGSMKDSGSEQVRRQLRELGFSENQTAFVLSLVPGIVDTTLHHLLWTLEQDQSVKIEVETPSGSVPSLREVSDGLAGELYDWMPRFSKQRHSDV